MERCIQEKRKQGRKRSNERTQKTNNKDSFFQKIIQEIDAFRTENRDRKADICEKTVNG